MTSRRKKTKNNSGRSRVLESVERFKELLIRKKLKYTWERQTICEEIIGLDRHFDADSLYERFKRRGLRISRDTVYRTIPLLLESGVIQKSAGRTVRQFFERTGRLGHHDHLICISCGKIAEFRSPEIEKLQERVGESHGFRLVFHDHRLYGYCPGCRSREKGFQEGPA
jgi:Fur family ferric uptake transcriptional regulator